MRTTAHQRTSARKTALAVATVAAFCSAWITQQSAAKPNIVVFYTDDQGWTDTSVPMMVGRSDSRGGIFNTPNLQRMANAGMVFSNAYSPSPVCSSSRDSILYGMTPARLHHSILIGKANRSVDALTTPRAIKVADPDYVTAHFGKWACSPKTPEDAGFDVSDGRTDNWHGDWRMVDGKKTPLPADDPKRMFSVTERANAFMEQQVAAGRPFFMRISHYAVHVKLAALEETIQKYRTAGHDQDTTVYAAMAENLDSALGSVLDKLNSLDISDETYVIFTSDNGGGFRGNGPLQGGKASLWEGGIRVPTVICGPGVSAGTYCDIPIVGWDFLPTFHDLAGGNKPLPKELDGGSLRSLFEDGNQGIVRRNVEPLIFHYPWYDSVPMSVIRQGNYKLVMDLNTNQTRLFNVVDDIGETSDLSEKMPQRKQQLRAKMTTYLVDVEAEDLEELRADREQTLRNWILRDTGTVTKLKEQIDLASGKTHRQELAGKMESIQRRIKGTRAALERVATGRHLTAW